MTVPATARRAGPFTGNGSTLSFPFTFKVFGPSDIRVDLRTAAGVESVGVLNTDYIVTLNGDQSTTPGGSITYAVGGVASVLPSGAAMAVTGQRQYAQTTTLPTGGAYQARAVEDALDSLEMQIQQVQDATDRSLTLSPLAPAGLDTALPPPAANSLLGWNETGTALQNVDPATAASIVAYGTGRSDTFTGDGATSAFVLSANPSALNNLRVAVGGVVQTPGADYVWTTGTTLAFTSAPPAGVTILVQYQQALPQGASDSAVAVYQPAGTGAVQRTVQAKLRESISVLDFGAVGDGVADDTAAINAAISYAKANAVKCVVVPSGNYKTTATINIGGDFGAGIEFWGQQATITCSGNVPIIDINCRVPDTPPQVRINAYVHGFTLVGPGKANTSSVGVMAQRGAGVKVENCSITGVYRGVWGFGNLISHYSDLNIFGTFMGLQFEPDGIEFAANDIHYTRLKVFDNDRVCRMINSPNGAMTFIGCEFEGNNLAGSVADGVRVAEFFNAGKVTMIGCHMEANPGEFNLYFDGNNGAHLNVIGPEFIPGDSCGNVLFMANATGSPSLFVQGGRITNNVTGHQIVLSSGVKATVIGQTAGAVSGDLSKCVILQNGLVNVGRVDSLAGGVGVAFPVTQSPSTDPNTLDDYAEGTFTPVVIGLTTAGTATYANQNARYTKIGRQVFVEMWINWSAGTGSGAFAISGLPFVVSPTPFTYPSANIARTNLFAWTAGNMLSANFEPGTSQIVFYQVPVGGGTAIPVTYDGTAYIMVSGTYTV